MFPKTLSRKNPCFQIGPNEISMHFCGQMRNMGGMCPTETIVFFLLNTEGNILFWLMILHGWLFRDDMPAITREIGTKTEEEVKQYSTAFWSNYKLINGNLFPFNWWPIIVP